MKPYLWPCDLCPKLLQPIKCWGAISSAMDLYIWWWIPGAFIRACRHHKPYSILYTLYPTLGPLQRREALNAACRVVTVDASKQPQSHSAPHNAPQSQDPQNRKIEPGSCFALKDGFKGSGSGEKRNGRRDPGPEHSREARNPRLKLPTLTIEYSYGHYTADDFADTHQGLH